jgi:hypothetical protein
MDIRLRFFLGRAGYWRDAALGRYALILSPALATGMIHRRLFDRFNDVT